jgi:uroporphyrinogen III methyltransferase/synthase
MSRPLWRVLTEHRISLQASPGFEKTPPAGKVYLVGAGPGDPALLTRRGEVVLSQADVVVYDHLANLRLLDLAPEAALRVCAGKSSGHCTLSQEEIQQILLEHARAGRNVVRLKGGDPLVFGRGAEEAVFLRGAGIPFEIVPGVTAALGATAYAGIPITHRQTASAVAFVTGHDDPESEQGDAQLDWAALARFPGTLVVYMGVTHLEGICRKLAQLGKAPDTPAAIIESGTYASQRTLSGTLETIARAARDAQVRPPALLVVGPVVDLRRHLAWYEDLPLFAQRILVTRPRDEALRSACSLEALGAEVVLGSTVEIRPVADPAPLDAAIDRLATYDWLVFTSANGVRYFLSRLRQRGRDLRALGRLKLAAIGPSTARALADFQLTADLIPESYQSESLVESLSRAARGTRVLLARADRGRTLLKVELGKLAAVDQVAVYHQADVECLPESVVDRIADGTIDWITLTSSAITARLHALLPERARKRIGTGVRLVSISPVTSETVRRLGWTVSAEASEFTWEGLVRALVSAAGRVRTAQ